MEAPEPETSSDGPFPSWTIGADIEGNIVSVRVSCHVAQPDAFLRRQGIWIVISDEDRSGHAFAKRIGIVLLVIEHIKLFLQGLKTLGRNRAGGNSPGAFQGQRFCMKLVLVLDGGKMQHHTTEHLVAL